MATYFISDLHLGAKYIADPREHEARVVRFLDQVVARDATALYLLGDILDYWYEYKTVVPRGHVRFFGALARLGDAGVKIYWYLGNHDIWLFDYLSKEIGLTVVDGYTVGDIEGRRCLLNHGDGVGQLPRTFGILRRIFRNGTCQKLYAAIHPRWTVGFARRWSSHSRKAGGYETADPFDANKDFLAQFAREYLADVDPSIDYFIFGHRHTATEIAVGPHSQLVILGEWVTLNTYARLEAGQPLQLLKYE